MIIGYNGYQGAGDSSMRGAIYWPSVDSRREISSYTRRELARRGRWAYENLPLARHLVDCLTSLVVGEDGYTALPMTADREWNEERAALWKNKTENPGLYDLRRRWDIADASEALLRGRYVDGDMFAVLTKTPDGQNSRFTFHEGTLVGNGNDIEGRDWQDGVRLGRYGGPLAYRFLEFGAPGEVRHKDIPARDVIHFADIKRPGHSRSVSRLSVALNDLLDRAEIKGFVKHGVKIRNRIGLLVKGIPARRQQFGASAVAEHASKSEAQLQREREYDMEKVMGGGQVIETPTDGDAKILSDDSPHVNYQQWDEQIIREISIGFGVPYEVVWALGGLTSPNARFLIGKTQLFRGREGQRLVRQVLSRQYAYDTAVLIKNGGIREPADPLWWLHGFLAPERLTIDRGRDGAMLMKMNRRALITARNIYGASGQYWRTEIDHWAEEEAYRTAKLLAELGEREVTVEDYLRLNAESSSVSGTAAGESDSDPAPGQRPDPDGDEDPAEAA